MKMPIVQGAVALLIVALAGSGHLPLASLYAASLSTGPARHAAAQSVQAAPGSVPSRAFFEQYCDTCHNNRLKTGGLSLDGVEPTDVAGHAEVLEKVVRKLRSGQMPPLGRPRADDATVGAFANAIESRLDRAAAQAPNPGRIASHRLNRAEYVNAIEDLLALRVNGHELLPSDMAGFGFDNNADVLAITPGLMARYMAAATKISRIALASPDNRPMMQLYKVEFGTRQDSRMNEDMPFGTHGGLSLRHTFPLDGEYLFAVRLKRNGTVSTIDGIEEDEHEIELRVDHALVKRFKIGGRYKGPDPGVLIAVPEDDIEGNLIHDYRLNADKELEIRVPVKAGMRLVTVAFTDSAPTPEAALQARGGYMPGVDTVAVSGPFNGKVPADTPSRRQIFVCRPSGARDEDACARQILSALARRAYRRPVAATDIDPLVAIYREGRSEHDFDGGIERALEALLSSPKFLIRIERDPAGAKAGSLTPITDMELASRLSFFLWRSIPDDELLDLAERGKLKDPAVMRQQVRRMIADRRSTRFMNDFVEQWLQVRNIESQEPDASLFPGFDSTLRNAMAKETQLFFESQVREDRPIQDLLKANYTFLNERLARHYGITDVFGSHFRRVALTNENRFGLLGQASVLTVTSYANRTSVVLRGKWVLENLLGAPPPPPPPNVPPLKENDGKSKPAALRERMEAHRASPVCASCHSRMDPLGFALEHFDAVGRWRENDGGAEINSTITWAGRTVDSPKAFREALLGIGGGNEYMHTVVEKLLTYALGRGMQYFDAPTIRQLGRDSERDGYKWSTLVAGVVTSLPFQMRRVEYPPAATVAVVR